MLLKLEMYREKVAVLGAGPIGFYSACASLALGAESVYVSDLKQTRLDVASRFDDLRVVNPTETPISTIFSKTDVIIETTGSDFALKEALPHLQKGGITMMVGLFPGEVSLDVSSLVRNEITFRRIIVRIMRGTRYLMEKPLLENKLNVLPSITHQFSLENYEEAFRLSLSGEGTNVLLRP